MSIHEEVEKRAKEIQKEIQPFLPEEIGFQKVIFSAMNYSFLGGGKRLRPMFMKETYRLFGGQQWNVVEPFMAAIEMIHTYSLVHDDLPAMDDDDYRRGRLTTHKVYGEDMGILAGDALLNFAYETALKGFSGGKDDNRVVEALKILANKAGVYGMVGGQVVDVQESGKEITMEQLLFIFEKKTSALLEASMMIGCVLAGGTSEEVMKIQQIARYVGVAFQIQDDILDVVGDQEVIGKPIHSDEKNLKTTYVSLVGLEEAKEAVRIYSEKANQMLAQMEGDSEFLEALIEMLICRNK